MQQPGIGVYKPNAMNQRLSASLLLAALAACAGYGPGTVGVGSTEAQAVQTLGQPTSRYTMPGGTQRLEFARGPYGRHTYMVDLDAQGRVANVEQVLDARHFARVMPGQTRDEVLRTIGRPGERVGMMRDGQIWSWRYANNDCLWWQAQFDAQGIVTAAGYAPERGCDGPNDRSARMMPR
jgi:hypothetical protein